MKSLIVAVMVILAVGFTGCSGGINAPLTPCEMGEGQYNSQGHYLLNLWRINVLPDEGRLEITPLRTGELHLNALPFLEPPVLLNLTLESAPVFNGNILDVDIGLRHPLLGLQQFTGFDVCGILISSGSVDGFDDPVLRMPGDGDTRLLNPDGYSRWWNPAEFPGDGTIFGYTDGLLGTPDSIAGFDATLNGYKFFCDDLSDLTMEVGEMSPSSRCEFSAGQKNIRHYTIELGDDGLVFNYAVDACWRFPVGQAPWEVPEDFPQDANRSEAWHISVTELSNTLWNDGVTSGGALALNIDVWDHFNADVNTIKVESPGAFDAATTGIALGGGDGYSTYEIEITSATPPAGEIDLLISIISEKENFDGYITGTNTTAYFGYKADVAGGTPPEGTFVDGDNAGDPDMNGSYTHPFDTIQAGINAAGDYEDVNVDAISGGGIYDEAVVLKTGVSVLGNNWNGGVGKPKVTSSSAGRVFFGADVCDTLIDGFEIIMPTGPPVHYWSGDTMVGIHIEDSKADYWPGSTWSTFDNTIRRCRFTGSVTYAVGCKGIFLEAASGTTVELCEFGELNGISGEIFDIINAVFAHRSQDVIIRQNWVHDLIADASADSGRIDVFRFLWGDNLVVSNNLVHDINGINGYCNIRGVYIDGQPDEAHSNNPVVINNTFDGFYNEGNYGFIYGINFSNTIVGSFAIPNITLYNNIISNSNSDSHSSHAYGHGQPDPSDPCIARFCNAYNTAWIGHSHGGYYNITKGTGCYVNNSNPQDPDYIDPPYDHDLSAISSSQLGHPDIVDWDDTGVPSGDPDDTDTNTRSRMGAFGGPDGGWWPLD